MNYYPFHIGDYAAHTQRLSLMEDLAYRRLIDAYYLAERPFIGCAADVAREIGMQEQLDAVKYVLTKFFVATEDGFSNERCDKEITLYRDKQAKASAAGKASAQRRSSIRSTSVEKQATSVGESSTDVQLTNNQEPITNINTELAVPAKPPRSKPRSQLPIDFFPNDAGQAAAVAKGLHVANEFQKFHDYHRAKGSVMADWQAAWRTWVGNARPLIPARQLGGNEPAWRTEQKNLIAEHFPNIAAASAQPAQTFFENEAPNVPAITLG